MSVSVRKHSDYEEHDVPQPNESSVVMRSGGTSATRAESGTKPREDGTESKGTCLNDYMDERFFESNVVSSAIGKALAKSIVLSAFGRHERHTSDPGINSIFRAIRSLRTTVEDDVLTEKEANALIAFMLSKLVSRQVEKAVKTVGFDSGTHFRHGSYLGKIE